MYTYKKAPPPQQGDNAKLFSPPLKLPANMCLEFYYYMSGEAVGRLNVIIYGKVVFSVIDDTGDMWHKASINVSSILGSHRVSFI